LTERTRQDRADAGRVRKIEYRQYQAIAVFSLKIGKAALTPCRGDDAITTSEEALRH
jgi:hypothetical protein